MPKQAKLKSFTNFVQKQKLKKKYSKVNGLSDSDGGVINEDEGEDNDNRLLDSVDLVADEEEEQDQPEDRIDFETQLVQIRLKQREKELEEERLAAIKKVEIREKRIQTIGYCLCYCSLGLAAGALGPSLTYLAENTNSTIDKLLTYVVGARAIGWIVGSIAAGKMYERYPGNRVLWIATAITALLVAVIPVIPEFWTLAAVCAVNGAFMSWIEVGVNTLAIWIWKEEVGPYMQFLHFAFGAGEH